MAFDSRQRRYYMIATILENPRRIGRTSKKRRSSRRIRLGVVGKVRRSAKRRRRVGVGAWTGASRKHAKASRKGWARRRGGVSLAIAPNPRRRSRRRSMSLGSPKKLHRLGRHRRSRRVGLGSPLIPTTNMLESTALAIAGIALASKGGKWLDKTLGCSALGGILSGNIGEYLTAFGATVLGTMAVEKFSTKERADAVQLGGLAFIGLKALGNLVGVSISESPSCGHFLGLGDYKRISGLGEDNPYQLEEVVANESSVPFAGIGAYERVATTPEFYPPTVTGVF